DHREKRPVDRPRAPRPPGVSGAQVARLALNAHTPGFLRHLPRQLVDTAVHGETARGAVLEQAVGKPASRAADVEAQLIGNREVKIFERAFELQPASAGVAKPAADDFDVRAGGN